MQDIELILEECQEYYYNGNLEKAIDLFEKNESIVNSEGFDDNLKIHFYVSYIATLVVTILIEKGSFKEIEKRILICRELIKDKKFFFIQRLIYTKDLSYDKIVV